MQNSSQQLCVDSRRAKLIARLFFEQYYPIVLFRDVFLKENVWTIKMDVGLVKDHNIQLKIDAESGKILGYS